MGAGSGRGRNRVGLLNHILRNLKPNMAQTIAAVAIPTKRSPRVPRVVPVNGNHNGEHRPMQQPYAIINIRRLLVFFWISVGDGVVASAVSGAPAFASGLFTLVWARTYFFLTAAFAFFSSMAAWAAARRAMGTQKGEKPIALFRFNSETTGHENNTGVAGHHRSPRSPLCICFYP